MRASSRNAILGILLVAGAMAAATSASRAQYYPWCLILSDKVGSWTCYFATREQCMASAGGNMGFCTQNPAYPGPQPAPSRRHRANG
jgi:Protein of unknown function (DUF3551)